MFQKRHNHAGEILGAGLLGVMLGVAGSLALTYPDDRREKTRDFLNLAKDKFYDIFAEEEVIKPLPKNKRRIIPRRLAQ